MLVGMRGVLVRQVSSSPGGIFQVSWLRADVPSLIPPGRIMLVWESMEGAARRVTARLGLPGGQVLLAVWPSLRGDWSDVVRPTVAEVTGLYSALCLATIALEYLVE
jgi:hypothetical protein